MSAIRDCRGFLVSLRPSEKKVLVPLSRLLAAGGNLKEHKQDLRSRLSFTWPISFTVSRHSWIEFHSLAAGTQRGSQAPVLIDDPDDGSAEGGDERL
ncbi:hypothetical protein WN48_04658 [Eufriesea mexicana]|uniref:Uncharacterized protein n=1 Tax=Eufriesea mexicana TaxID=516756 RepID=A0A310SQ97_9HYME|nr:hypothetical protein WN48_04658 [Eufriesea mexicana]